LEEFVIKPEETKVGFFPREAQVYKGLEFDPKQREENQII
jgi:hypothetical protein